MYVYLLFTTLQKLFEINRRVLYTTHIAVTLFYEMIGIILN